HLQLVYLFHALHTHHLFHFYFFLFFTYFLFLFSFFFFNATATTEIYTLSLHDALPISSTVAATCSGIITFGSVTMKLSGNVFKRSEEHTSELQSQSNLVCRLLLEKKKKKKKKKKIKKKKKTIK